MAAEAVATGQRISLGNKAAWGGYVTMSGLVSGAACVLGYIEGGNVNIRSANANNSHSIHFNYASGSTATDGWLRIASAADGDVFDVLVWGRP